MSSTGPSGNAAATGERHAARGCKGGRHGGGRAPREGRDRRQREGLGVCPAATSTDQGLSMVDISKKINY